MTEQSIIDSFQTMWGHFPEPVLLVRKDRTILALNDMAGGAGLKAGVRCFSLNPEAGGSVCKSCKAGLALREYRSVRADEQRNCKAIIGYWIPLATNPDIYLHFGIGTAAALGISTPSPVRKVASAAGETQVAA